MKILCVIPARFGSERFPGKPLFPLAGRPMIEWVHGAAQKSESFEEIIVATDDQRIADEVYRFGGQAMMTSVDHPTGTDRLLEVMDHRPGFDAFVNLQGDEPLMDPKLLREMVLLMKDLPAESVLTPVHVATKAELENPNVVKVVKDIHQRACYFSRAPIPYQRGEEVPSSALFKHIGLYAFSLSALQKIRKLRPHPIEQMERLEQLRWLLNGIPIYIHETKYQSQGVDTREQASEVERLLRKNGLTADDAH